MYGKLFTQMYTGTLASKGPWEALVTFQQLIILSDPHGVVDMTAEAISRQTTIPLEIIRTGLAALERVDIASRTPNEEGRRITRLSDSRDWGWQITNYVMYRNIRSQEDRRTYMREYQRKRRAVNKPVNSVSNVNQSSKQYEEVEEKEKIKTIVGLKPDAARVSKNAELRKAASQVIEFLNEKAGRNFDLNGANADHVIARLKDGETVEDLRAVVAMKCREWKGNEDMSQYLRPETLFNRKKFASYKGALSAV